MSNSPLAIRSGLSKQASPGSDVTTKTVDPFGSNGWCPISRSAMIVPLFIQLAPLP